MRVLTEKESKQVAGGGIWFALLWAIPVGMRVFGIANRYADAAYRKRMKLPPLPKGKPASWQPTPSAQWREP
jgi:hypothetical protein